MDDLNKVNFKAT